MKKLTQSLGNSLSRPTLNFLMIFILLISLMSCGKNPQNQILKDVYVEAYEQDSDVWIKLVSDIKIANMVLTSLTLPILDPRMPGEKYGELSFKPSFAEGESEITMALNLTKVAKIRGDGEPTLPNGSSLPIADVNDEMIELEIEEINSKIYLSLDSNSTVIGFAISIKEFDVMSDYLGGTNIFLGSKINEVLAIAGFYTSTNPGQSGIGMFVDLSSVFTAEILNDLVNNSFESNYVKNQESGLLQQSAFALKSFQPLQKTVKKTTFQTSKLSSSKKKAILKGVYKMQKKGNYLHPAD